MSPLGEEVCGVDSANASFLWLRFSQSYRAMVQVLGLRKLHDLVTGTTRVASTPVCLLGRWYGVEDETGVARLTPEAELALVEDFSSKVWCTYRRDFLAIGHTPVTSDVGWGCTLRSGQMLVAEALVRHMHGAGNAGVPSASTGSIADVVALFWDHPSANCPFSIHNICKPEHQGVVVGRWLGPWVLCKALESIIVSTTLAGLRVHVVCEPGGGAPALDCSRVLEMLEQSTAAFVTPAESSDVLAPQAASAASTAASTCRAVDGAVAEVVCATAEQACVGGAAERVGRPHPSAAASGVGVAPRGREAAEYGSAAVTTDLVGEDEESSRQGSLWELLPPVVPPLASGTQPAVETGRVLRHDTAAAAPGTDSPAYLRSPSSVLGRISAGVCANAPEAASIAAEEEARRGSLPPEAAGMAGQAGGEAAGCGSPEAAGDFVAVEEEPVRQGSLWELVPPTEPGREGGTEPAEEADRGLQGAFGEATPPTSRLLSCAARPGVLILIPLTLGVDKVHPRYLPQVQAVLSFPQSVGIVGGRPGSSLYFVGYQDTNILYLDPHEVQPVAHLPVDLPSYFCSTPRLTPVATIDPSMAIGFYVASRVEFDDLRSRLRGLEAAAAGAPLLTVMEDDAALGAAERSASRAPYDALLLEGLNLGHDRGGLEPSASHGEDWELL